MSDVRQRAVLTEAAIRLCAAQGGVLARRQLLGLGMSRRVLSRMLAEELLHVVQPGIYARGPEVGWLGRAWSGLIVGGGLSVLGLEAAAFLHRLTRDEPPTIAVFTQRQVAHRPGFQFIRGARTGAGEPVRTSREATVLDLCARADEDAIAALLADVISSRRVSAKRLRNELQRRERLANGVLIKDVLGDVAVGAHSALERRYLNDVERAHGLPAATRQASAAAGQRSDAWYEEFNLLIELDSKLHHCGAAAFRDMTRDNNHALRGLTTLRLGWKHVTGSASCESAQLVAQALTERGWTGIAQACSHCALVHEWHSV